MCPRNRQMNLFRTKMLDTVWQKIGFGPSGPDTKNKNNSSGGFSRLKGGSSDDEEDSTHLLQGSTPLTPASVEQNVDSNDVELLTSEFSSLVSDLELGNLGVEGYFERRNDREEIRKKLAMDSDNEEYYCGERVTRKPSLTTRLQSGMNLQICFMNETASDHESLGSDSENGNNNNHVSKEQQRPPNNDRRISAVFQPAGDVKSDRDDNTAEIPTAKEAANLKTTNTTTNGDVAVRQNTSKRPSFFFNRRRSWRQKKGAANVGEEEPPTPNPPEDFLTRHTRLQAEARHALAQAKEMARMQMEVERQTKKKSPIAEIVGLPFPDGHYRLSRHTMMDMNVAQLQVIVNDMHSQIESLNEDLVRLLLERDDLHMEQDSMLVDIEDLTKYLRAKDEAFRSQPPLEVIRK